jgi:hypothetical protein
LRAQVPLLPPALRAVALGDATRMAPPVQGGEVLTDDRAPVEWLIDASIVKYAADGSGG